MENLLRCFQLPQVGVVIIGLTLFLFAYLFYCLLFFLLRRLSKEGGLWEKVVKELRIPTFFLLFAIAALISIHTPTIPKGVQDPISHFLNLILIAVLGWVAGGITRACYRNFLSKAKGTGKTDLAHREILTQVLFIYRFVMFAIVCITLAIILMTFPSIKNIGVGILGSAGIVGIALGIAARPILLNVMAGFQIAATKTINIGDNLHVEGESARVESIHLTHVVVRTWDRRRIILPISYFIDKPFQNWDTVNPEVLGGAFIYCDYTVPVESVRARVKDLLADCPYWNKREWSVHVTSCTSQCIEIRVSASSNDSSEAFELKAYLREKIIDFLQQEYPHALPCLRNRTLAE